MPAAETRSAMDVCVRNICRVDTCIDRGRSVRGATLVELLVAVAIVGGLAGLLLPAVQQSRESTRGMTCQNNLKQLGVGFHNYETAKGFFPTTVNISSGATHYWVAQLLPYMDSNPLAGIYDYTVAFSSVNNREAVQYPLSFMSCPSTPGGPLPDPRFKQQSGVVLWGSIAADYAGATGIAGTQWTSQITYAKPINADGFFAGQIKQRGGSGLKVKNVTDGTSKSVAVFECAGRPQVWYYGQKVPDSGGADTGSKYVSLSGWPSANSFLVRGFSPDPTQSDPSKRYKFPGPTMINGSNDYGVYSFHKSGAGMLFVDGSCRVISDATSADVVAAVLTIAGGEAMQVP